MERRFDLRVWIFEPRRLLCATAASVSSNIGTSQRLKPTSLRNAGEIGSVFEGSGARLLLNDFPHLVAEAGWDGVHVGQADGSVAEARRQVGPDRLVGVSTHTVAQLHRAAATDADYIAYGPIFATGSKVDAETPVGLPGLRGVRRLDSRPLVAIGGISRERMSDVFGAGADCVALIGALYRGPATLLDNVSQILETAALAGRFTDGRREHSH